MLPTSCSAFALVTNSSGGKKSLQAIYEWKKNVTLDYYSLQIIHTLFHASSLSIHQNFCSIQGWEMSCYSFLFSCIALKV